VKVLLPAVMAEATSGAREVEVSASTVSDALGRLTEKFGEPLKQRMFDESGRPKRLLSLFVNGKNIRFLKSLETELRDGDEVSILPTVSGG